MYSDLGQHTKHVNARDKHVLIRTAKRTQLMGFISLFRKGPRNTCEKLVLDGLLLLRLIIEA